MIAERLILTTFLLQPESVSNRVKFNDRLALNYERNRNLARASPARPIISLRHAVFIFAG